MPAPVSVIGLPTDENSSFLRGPALAPARIRAEWRAGATNDCAENGVDLGASSQWRDLGDLALGTGAAARDAITAAVGDALTTGGRTLALGGDHSVTYPILRAYGPRYPDLSILHIDAHADLYASYDGNPYSHACPFARIMEDGLARRLVQVGVRTLNPQQREQSARFGTAIIEMRHWRADALPTLTGPVYLSLDLDALDPAFAPGVSHHEPGGFTVRDVLGIIHNLPAPLVGADIVEYNPTRDVADLTAMVAVKFLKEILAQMVG
jgi:agmatinase